MAWVNAIIQGVLVGGLYAGYAGLVSVGQQAFVGLGAYFVLIALSTALRKACSHKIVIHWVL